LTWLKLDFFKLDSFLSTCVLCTWALESNQHMLASDFDFESIDEAKHETKIFIKLVDLNQCFKKPVM